MASEYDPGLGRVPQWLSGVVQGAPSTHPPTVINTEHSAAQNTSSIRHADAALINVLCRPLFDEAPETRGHSYCHRVTPGKLRFSSELIRYRDGLLECEAMMNTAIGQRSLWLASNSFNVLHVNCWRLLDLADYQTQRFLRLEDSNLDLRYKLDDITYTLQVKHSEAERDAEIFEKELRENTETLREKYERAKNKFHALEEKHELSRAKATKLNESHAKWRKAYMAVREEREALKSQLEVGRTETETTTRDMTALQVRNELLQQKVYKLEASLLSERKIRKPSTVMTRSKTRSRISKTR